MRKLTFVGFMDFLGLPEITELTSDEFKNALSVKVPLCVDEKRGLRGFSEYELDVNERTFPDELDTLDILAIAGGDESLVELAHKVLQDGPGNVQELLEELEGRKLTPEQVKALGLDNLSENESDENSSLSSGKDADYKEKEKAWNLQWERYFESFLRNKIIEMSESKVILDYHMMALGLSLFTQAEMQRYLRVFDFFTWLGLNPVVVDLCSKEFYQAMIDKIDNEDISFKTEQKLNQDEDYIFAVIRSDHIGLQREEIGHWMDLIARKWESIDSRQDRVKSMFLYLMGELIFLKNEKAFPALVYYLWYVASENKELFNK